MAEYGTMRVKSGLAEMLKGGVIMDVVNAEQARIAEESGAVAVMALERVPADIRVQGGVARMSDPEMIREIQESVTIPVMAKCRIGHFAEAQILEALEIDYIDESEVLTPADLEHHVDKWKFTVPFVCGATNLGEALRRIGEGAAMIRTKGEAGTGDIVNAVTHMRSVFGNIRKLTSLAGEELYSEAKKLQAPYELVRWVAEHGRLPVVTFTAGGLTVLSAGMGALGYLSSTSGSGALAGWALLVLVVLYGLAHDFRRRDRQVAAGIFAFVSVIAWGAFVGLTWRWFGWLGTTSSFKHFSVARLSLELLILIAARDDRRRFGFPFITLISALVGWFFVVDLITSGGSWTAFVTLVIG